MAAAMEKPLMSASLAGWPVYLKQELSSIPEVVSAFVAFDGPTSMRVVVFVSQYTDDILDKVLDVEDHFTSAYRGRDERFRFDILATPRHGNAADVVPGVTQVYYRA